VTDGQLIWSHSFPRDFQAETPIWGFAGHPFVDGNRLICLVGGPDSLVVAFDKRTGEVLWKALNDPLMGYSSPNIVEAGGIRQLLVWHGAALSSLDPDTGKEYWSLPLEPNYGMSIITPRMSRNEVFVGGIVNKSMLVSLSADRPDAEVKWFGDARIGIDPVHSTPFFESEYLYGVDREGQLFCIDRSDGRRVWGTFELMPEKRRVHSGSAFLVKNGDHFFIFTDSGELVIARLSPSGYEEQSRTKIIEPTGDALGRAVVWSHPAFAHRSAFVRNDREIIRVSLAEE
jgi:outer membrane protein assembly factor BamB